MKTKTITYALIALATALCISLFIFQRNQTQSPVHTTTAPFDSSSNQANAIKLSPNGADKTTISLEQILHKIASHQHEGKVNQQILDELKSFVFKTQREYDAVFTTYQDAISSYERMSADFDAQLRGQAKAEVLGEIDQLRLVKAQEILQLKQSLNKAYLELMAKFDEAIPHLMAKHFARPN